MPHIKMTIEAARRHVKSTKPNMFDIPQDIAIGELDKMEADGAKFLMTEGCPTFDTKGKGCQCDDMSATRNIIKEREDIDNI